MSSGDMPRESRNAGESMQTRYPEFYGKLLEINATLLNPTSLAFSVYLFVISLACAAVWFEWYKAIPELQDAELGGFGTYAIVIGFGIAIWIGHIEIVLRLRYRKYREEILQRRAARELGGTDYLRCWQMTKQLLKS